MDYNHINFNSIAQNVEDISWNHYECSNSPRQCDVHV